jgi:hypothetical protein
MLVSASGRSRFSRRFLLPSPLADGHARALPSRGEERESAKFGQHHGPGGRFRDGGDRPKSPPVSPSMPSVKKRVFEFPSFPPPPKARDQRPPGALPEPGLTSIEPSNAQVDGLKASITLSPKANRGAINGIVN